jgi:hypothetical protein
MEVCADSFLSIMVEMYSVTGRDADLLIVMNREIPTDDLIVHFL